MQRSCRVGPTKPFYLALGCRSREAGRQHLRGAPGRRARPYRYHLANEEAIYVLESSGSVPANDDEKRSEVNLDADGV